MNKIMDPRAPYRSGSIVISWIIDIFPRNVTSLLMLFPYFVSLRVYIVKLNQLIQVYIKITNKILKLQHLRGAEVQLHSFLTSALDGCEWSASRPGRFTYSKELRYPLNRRLCVPHTADLDVSKWRKKSLSYAGLRKPIRPDRHKKKIQQRIECLEVLAWALRFSLQWVWMQPYCGKWRRVVLQIKMFRLNLLPPSSR